MQFTVTPCGPQATAAALTIGLAVALARTPPPGGSTELPSRTEIAIRVTTDSGRSVCHSRMAKAYRFPS